MVSRLLRLLSFQFIRVRGESMMPAIKPGRRVRVDQTAYRTSPPARFDVVWYEDAARLGGWSVKRVVGLPGEQVRLEGIVLTVDGAAVEQPMAVRHFDMDFHEWVLQGDELVLLGDNRAHSTDSRTHGPVKLSALRGRVILK